MGAWPPMSRAIPKIGKSRAATWISLMTLLLLSPSLFLSLRNVGNSEATVIKSRKDLGKHSEMQGDKMDVDGLGGAEEALNKVSKGSEGVPFLLVTGERSSACVTPAGNNVMMKSYKNKVDYCNLHGCKVWYALEVWQNGFVGTWVRYPLLLRLMITNPSVPWFMWMDSDAIFTDFNFSIPFHRYNGWSKNLVVPGFWEKVYGKNPDWMGLNAGIFLIRNCEWSHRFLEKWMELGAPENLEAAKKALNTAVKSRPREWDPDDQSALVYLLNRNRSKSEKNVFLEASYSLHGYFEYIIDKFEDILEGKDKCPFVTHFSGCNFCGSADVTERCRHGFQRAFNFADNQLFGLNGVGLRHSSLSTSASTLQPISSSA